MKTLLLLCAPLLFSGCAGFTLEYQGQHGTVGVTRQSDGKTFVGGSVGDGKQVIKGRVRVD